MNHAANYPGGKGAPGVFQTLINQIPAHSLYVAAFAGCDAIGRHKRPAERSVFCDLDADALRQLRGFFAAAWPSAAREFHNADGLAWLRFYFGLDRLQKPAPREPVAPFAPGERPAFVYLDPPYPLDVRSSGPFYKFELTDDQHAELLAIAKALPCPVMVSSYRGDLYDRELHGHGWRRIEYQTTTRGGPKIEAAYMNYPEPVELHDASFVGCEKRERERIKKRAGNWSASLARMSNRERQAVLQAIADHFTPTGSPKE